uniref:Acyl-CoA:glycerol-3-phosphate acyltransferase n=1 Tax=Schistosoma mansoni TaxID=6183 RepID=A0A5K4F0Y2_SCHMA
MINEQLFDYSQVSSTYTDMPKAKGFRLYNLLFHPWILMFFHFFILTICDGGNVISYSTNMNQQNISIPISTNISGVFRSTATCSFLKTPIASDTNGLFSEILLSDLKPNGTIAFQCSQVGHEVLFFCHDKVNSSVLFSNKSWIQCRKPPVVSIAPRTVRLLKKPTPFNQRMIILTSEIVSESNIIVTCLKKDESTDILVSINPVTVYSGTSTGVVSVTIQSISSAQSFTISCKAQSINGNQYTSATSEGSSSVISLISGEIILTPNDVNLYSLQFQVLLFLNGLNQDLGVLCSVNVANNETQANNLLSDNTCGIVSTNVVPSSSWSVTPSLNEFRASSISSRTDSLTRLLTVKRNSYPTSEYDNTMEILILKCCSTTNNVTMDPAFANIVTTSRINVLLKSRLIVNKGEELPTDQAFPYPDPVWTNISPCPCDLTINTCDLGCPCDNMCPVNQSTVKSSSFFGGYFNLPNYHSCDAMLDRIENQENKIDLINRGFTKLPDYHPLLCVAVDNSAVLGKYHSSLSPARSLSDFNKNVKNAKIEYPLDQISDSGVREVIVEQKNEKQRSYINGDPLLLMIQPVILTSSDDPIILVSQYNEYFVLPNEMNCDLESNIPVEYLSGRNTYRCPIVLSVMQCQDAINIKNNIGIGWGPRTLLDRLFARAYLIDDLAISRYSEPIFRLRMNRLRDDTPVPVKVDYLCLKQNELQNFTMSSQSNINVDQINQTGFFNHNCTYNATSKLTSCIPSQNSVKSNPLVPTTCPWHNGFDLPPDIDLLNNMCNNVVLKVDYKFVWSNGSIQQALAQVYVANLPVTSTETTYYQEYSVKFIHTTEVDNEIDTKLPSHLYGYELDDLIITGQVTSTSTQRFLVQTNDETNIKSGVMKTGPDMLCENSEVDQLKFGKTMITSCRVLLGLNDFTNCDKLRSLIIERLNQFMPSEVIATYPQASKTSPEDWIFIRRNNPVLQSSTGNDNTSALIGFCPNITSTIYLKIISAIQGKLQGIPLRQIIYASIEYSQENWQFLCDYSMYPSFCRNSTTLNDVQYFYLNTIIIHSDISAKDDQLTINEQLDCNLDNCWTNAFYAWTGLIKLYQFTGKYEQTFEIGVTLGISSLIIMILIVTKPFF